MWIARKLTQNEMQNTASAQSGTVTVEAAEPAVFSSGEDRNVKVVSPRGFFWKPMNGEKVLIIKGGVFGEEAYIVGAMQDGDTPEAGEIRIAPASGNAEIVLHNSGLVEINGNLFINGAPYIPLILGG